MQKKIVRFIYLEVFKVSIKFRNFYFRRLFASFGNNSNIFGRITVYYPENIFVGSHTSLNEGVELNARGGIEIGDYVHISSGTTMHSGKLNYKNTGEDRKHQTEKIVIENGVWVGSGAIILPGITIGQNSVVGAGAVVTKNIPKEEVWAGVPAKFLKKIYE